MKPSQHVANTQRINSQSIFLFSRPTGAESSSTCGSKKLQSSESVDRVFKVIMRGLGLRWGGTWGGGWLNAPSRFVWLCRLDRQTKIVISILHGLRIECNWRVTYMRSRDSNCHVSGLITPSAVCTLTCADWIKWTLLRNCPLFIFP